MYKVFKDKSSFILEDSKVFSEIENTITVCIKDPNTVNRLIENHLLSKEEATLQILCKQATQMIEIFESNYKVKIAAGGWVYNDKSKLLMIKRLGVWDIPKGHLEEGESIEECAIREVEEETGVENLRINNKIGITRHIFDRDGKDGLKVTHWYKMHTNYNQQLIPQEEEGIEDVCWVESNQIDEYLEKAWKSLKDFYFDSVKS